ncbi:alpha/beta fold hydrolase [Jannaschia aquimarina]|uniref:CatD_1 protein n=1 Tax=Jannaschia aquimarina TaxID=935700 RepID=A0A0D1CND7_9RHOB|nr:alpha/beta fold hydrolase [Jannaschia aquimarina]KIT16257.1 3-oxoadipate enol-lactonase 2 [Jannaschia aquimarina]SNT15140.1 3-oxoadipate enol-lactonase/3-oxoadipate enol-lactonase / 4-carboxymuconolactone decarboxylase [Jannaschia aquimarina]
MFEEVRGTALRVRRRKAEAGAPEVAFIHALGAGLWAWEGVAERLPRDWGLTLYDMRGHGLSGGAGPRLADHAADLLALAPKGAILCGLSIGGQIAMRAALDEPGRIRGLVLCATAAKIGDAARYSERAARVRREGMALFAREQVRRWFSEGFAAAHPEIVAGARHALSAQPVEGYTAACAAIGATDLTPDLARLALPCLCLGGGQDPSTGPDTIRALAAALPNARAEVLDGVGHLPPVEAPDVVANLIAGFCAGLHSVP